MDTLTLGEIAAGGSEPGDPAWASVASVPVQLVPVPIDAQPNAYIRAAWKERDYGRTPAAELAVGLHGDRLLVRLSWDGSGPVSGEFPDACGVLFAPGSGPGSPVTMGSPTDPVALWQWRDRRDVQQDLPAARHLVAGGPGVFRPAVGAQDLSASAELDGDRWTVVLSGSPPDALRSGGRVAVAVWNGANDERAGIGAVSAAWTAVTA